MAIAFICGGRDIVEMPVVYAVITSPTASAGAPSGSVSTTSSPPSVFSTVMRPSSIVFTVPLTSYTPTRSAVICAGSERVILPSYVTIAVWPMASSSTPSMSVSSDRFA